MLLLSILATPTLGDSRSLQGICGEAQLPEAVREAACLVHAASRKAFKIRREVGEGLLLAVEGFNEILAVRPSGEGTPLADFRVYWARLDQTVAAFLKPDDSASLKRVRGKWQWAQIHIREDLRSGQGKLEVFAEKLEKARRKLLPVYKKLREAGERLKTATGRSGQGKAQRYAKVVRREKAILEKALGSWEEAVVERVAPQVRHTASQTDRFVSDFDAHHISISEKLSDYHYRQDQDTRQKLVRKVKSKKAVRIRQGHTDLYQAIEEAYRTVHEEASVLTP